MTKNAVDVPIGPMTRPATAGPVILARLKTALFSAIAFGRSARPTISMANDCLVGLSTTVARPSPNASTYTCQIRTVPVTASTPRINARPPMVAWVTIRTRRLGYRSAIIPPHRLNSSRGRNCSPVAIPTATPLPCVSSSTSQSCATRCIQVPVFEITCPVANNR